MYVLFNYYNPVVVLDKKRAAEATLLVFNMERAKGIEPSSQAWEARILPMNYARMM